MKRLSRRIECPPVTLDDLTPSPDSEGFDPAYPNLKFGLINRIIRFDRNSRHQLPRNNMETSDIVTGVLEALKQTTVWKWCEAKMAQEENQQPGVERGMADGLDQGLDGSEEEADLDSLGADLDEAEGDLENAEMDEEPLREGRGRQVRHAKRPHDLLYRMEARMRNRPPYPNRHPNAVAKRGSISEDSRFEVDGFSTSHTSEPTPWRDMWEKVAGGDRGRPTHSEGSNEKGKFLALEGGSDAGKAHGRGKNESVYERQARAVKAAQELAEKWVRRSDVGGPSKDEAAKYLRQEDGQIDHYAD
jgi:hypothetical protein